MKKNVANKKRKISNNSFSILIEPPIKANGTEPIKYGVSNLKLKFPALE